MAKSSFDAAWDDLEAKDRTAATAQAVESKELDVDAEARRRKNLRLGRVKARG